MDTFPPGPARSPSLASEAPPRRTPRLLLLTEDEAQATELTTGLRLEGLPVLHVATLAAFQSAWDTFRPEMLLIAAPAEGYEPLPFAQEFALQDVDFIFLTQEAPSFEEEIVALELGAFAILQSPTDPHELAQILRTRAPRTHHVFTSLPEGAVAGTLATHPPTALMELLSRHHANARLHIERQGDWSVLLLRHGQLIDAEGPKQSGRLAAEEALNTTDGTFVLVPLLPSDEALLRPDVIQLSFRELIRVVKAPGRTFATARSLSRPKTTSELPHLGSPRAPLPTGDIPEFSSAQIASGSAQRAHTMLSAPAVSTRQSERYIHERAKRASQPELFNPRPPSGPIRHELLSHPTLAPETRTRDQRSIFEAVSEADVPSMAHPKADLDLSQARRLPTPPPPEPTRPWWPWLLALSIGLALLLYTL